MFGILVSAGRAILTWLLQGVVIKFVMLTALYYVITWIADTLLSQLDISPLTGLQSLIDQIPSSILWGMALLRFDVGLPLIFGAMLTKFLIRRLPIIG